MSSEALASEEFNVHYQVLSCSYWRMAQTKIGIIVLPPYVEAKGKYSLHQFVTVKTMI